MQSQNTFASQEAENAYLANPSHYFYGQAQSHLLPAPEPSTTLAAASLPSAEPAGSYYAAAPYGGGYDQPQIYPISPGRDVPRPSFDIHSAYYINDTPTHYLNPSVDQTSQAHWHHGHLPVTGASDTSAYTQVRNRPIQPASGPSHYEHLTAPDHSHYHQQTPVSGGHSARSTAGSSVTRASPVTASAAMRSSAASSRRNGSYSGYKAETKHQVEEMFAAGTRRNFDVPKSAYHDMPSREGKAMWSFVSFSKSEKGITLCKSATINPAHNIVYRLHPRSKY